MEIEAVNFGVTLKLNGEKHGLELTGIYPSPKYPDPEAIVRRVVEFLNEVLGTVYTVEKLELAHKCADCGEPLQAVRPGKYQCLNCEEKESERNDQQTEKVAVEAG